ncbi:DUF192 domain-containing protein [Candidatus Nomurabacteria bacterium]|nr:DUF192 domain-containing protein [Candidatus Nomurabacteria bacterium]
MKKFLSFLALFLFFSACGIESSPLPRTKIHLAGSTFQVELARDRTEQTKGLSGRASLAVDEGMLFVYADKQPLRFWMKEMLFPIDLLWIDGKTIVGFEENLPNPVPNTKDEDLTSFNSPQAVDKVLELPAGTVQRLKIQIGDQIN